MKTPTHLHMIIDRPAKAWSNAAVASKSDRIPGDKLFHNKSKKRTLFMTALLQVCPGIAYCTLSNAL
jgi:hypothetical protein